MPLPTLVTGGLGFVGSHLVDRLVRAGREVHVIDDLRTGNLSNANPQSKIIRLELTAALASMESRYDRIYHLANSARIYQSFETVSETIGNNFNTTLAICEYARRTASGPVFFASSSTTEFVEPTNNPYTFSKSICDQLIDFYGKKVGVRACVVKFYNVYGSMREADIGISTSVIRKFKKQYLNKEPLTVIGDGSSRRSFTSIEDTVDALMILDGLTELDGMYHIGSDKTYSISDIVSAFGASHINLPARDYERSEIACQGSNVPGWAPRVDLLDHIRAWVKANS